MIDLTGDSSDEDTGLGSLAARRGAEPSRHQAAARGAWDLGGSQRSASGAGSQPGQLRRQLPPAPVIPQVVKLDTEDDLDAYLASRGFGDAPPVAPKPQPPQPAGRAPPRPPLSEVQPAAGGGPGGRAPGAGGGQPGALERLGSNRAGGALGAAVADAGGSGSFSMERLGSGAGSRTGPPAGAGAAVASVAAPPCGSQGRDAAWDLFVDRLVTEKAATARGGAILLEGSSSSGSDGGGGDDGGGDRVLGPRRGRGASGGAAEQAPEPAAKRRRAPSATFAAASFEPPPRAAAAHGTGRGVGVGGGGCSYGFGSGGYGVDSGDEDYASVRGAGGDSKGAPGGRRAAASGSGSGGGTAAGGRSGAGAGSGSGAGGSSGGAPAKRRGRKTDEEREAEAEAKRRKQEDKLRAREEKAAAKIAEKFAKEYQRMTDRQAAGNLYEREIVICLPDHFARSALGMSVTAELQAKRSWGMWCALPPGAQQPLADAIREIAAAGGSGGGGSGGKGRGPQGDGGCAVITFKRRRLAPADVKSVPASAELTEPFEESAPVPCVLLLFHQPAAFVAQLRAAADGAAAPNGAAAVPPLLRRAAELHPHCSLAVLVVGLDSYLRSQEAANFRRGSSEFRAADVHAAFLRLQLSCPALLLRKVPNAEEAARHVLSLTRTLGQQPYKSKGRDDALGAARSGASFGAAEAAGAGRDLGQGAAKVAKCLSRVQGLGGGQAWAICRAYGGLGAMTQAFLRERAAGRDPAGAISELRDSCGAKRRVGPALGARLAALLTETDPNAPAWAGEEGG